MSDTRIRGNHEPLNSEDLQRIHTEALGILENVGIKAKSTSAKDVLAAAGATVEGDRVKIPRVLVAECLEKVASRVVLCGRDGRRDLVLEDDRVHLGTGGAALKVIDVGEKEPRASTLSDVARLARLVDQLDHIEFYLRPVVAQDVPLEKLDVSKFLAAMSNTTKHVMGSVGSPETYEQVKEMASIVAGSFDEYQERPFLSYITCWMRSPLTLDPGPTELMMRIVKDGLPVVLSSAPMAGSTAPVTLAGCLVQLHAEMLSGVVLTQLVSPGAPVLFGYVPSIADPRTMGYVGGSPEFGLLNAAAVQLARTHGLPNYSSAGLSDAKIPDAQAGIEKALTVLQVAQAGGNFIHHAAGMLESMLCVSYAQYVIDDDVLGVVHRTLRGIEVDERTLATDVIAGVGPDGDFLSQKHTAKNVRKETFFPRVMDRRSRQDWEADGGQDLWKAADVRASAMLAVEHETCLPQDVIDKIVETFEPVVA
jgi:trimethylamine--corrinoid protein Co-methyltransferase